MLDSTIQPTLVIVLFLLYKSHLELIVFLSRRQGFGRGNNKNNNNNNPPKMNNGTPNPQSSPVAYPPQVAAASPGTPGLPNSPSVTSNMSNLSIDAVSTNEESPKYFFQEKYAPLNVKGNFLTLCACPKNVELGEWLAHQSMCYDLIRFEDSMSLLS